MKVLIACEESQEVCKAFRARGHEAYSCDIQEPSGGHPEWHILGDAVPALRGGQIVTMDDKGHYIDAWDLLIAHPPCTYLSNAGARHLWKGHQLQEDRVMKGILGRDLFMRFWWADIPRICVENPVPSKVFCLPEYTQIIQPYQFGHPYSKKTCLWLKNLDPIMPTNIVEPIATWCPSGSYSHKHDEKSKGMFTRDRARNRAKTFPGVARAFAEQFGGQIRNRLTQRKSSAYSTAGSRRRTASQSGRPLSAASTTFRTPQQSASRNSAAICCRGLARSRPRGAGRFSALSRKPTSP